MMRKPLKDNDVFDETKKSSSSIYMKRQRHSHLSSPPSFKLHQVGVTV